MAGEFRDRADAAALRPFVGVGRIDLARALGISVHTVRGWEQGRLRLKSPAIALQRIAARHRKRIREDLASAA